MKKKISETVNSPWKLGLQCHRKGIDVQEYGKGMRLREQDMIHLDNKNTLLIT